MVEGKKDGGKENHKKLGFKYRVSNPIQTQPRLMDIFIWVIFPKNSCCHLSHHLIIPYLVSQHMCM